VKRLVEFYQLMKRFTILKYNHDLRIAKAE